jgi:large subunit ribosomal protein L32
VANPKWKLSRVRTRRRRSHNAIEAPNLVKCPDCKADMRPHHLCTSCGKYNGRQVISLTSGDEESQS